MVKCYKTKNLDSYYLEMGATEGFLKGEIKTLVDKLRDKEEEIKKLREEKEMLKQCLDKLMFDADVVNVKINGDVGDYVYVRSDKQFKLNIKD